jgi:outer membrane protein assembly factor BamB
MTLLNCSNVSPSGLPVVGSGVITSPPVMFTARPRWSTTTIYFGDSSGTFYAMTHNGSVLWTTKVQAAITDSALVTNGMVFFGDNKGNIYGLERFKGTLVWQVHQQKRGLYHLVVGGLDRGQPGTGHRDRNWFE